MDERYTSFYRFEDLRIYAKALDFSQWVHSNLPEPQAEGERCLYRSFIHAAHSIALNIAEGSSRNRTQFEHYLKNAKTGIRECVVFTTISQRRGLISEEQMGQSRALLMELTRMVGALIISLQRNAARQREEEDEVESESLDDMGGLNAVDTDFNTEFPNLN